MRKNIFHLLIYLISFSFVAISQTIPEKISITAKKANVHLEVNWNIDRLFSGTSAVCLHEARAFASLKGRTPQKLNQIKATLEAPVIDLGPPYKNTNSGSKIKFCEIILFFS